jgi:hypothetical protein
MPAARIPRARRPAEGPRRGCGAGDQTEPRAQGLQGAGDERPRSREAPPAQRSMGPQATKASVNRAPPSPGCGSSARKIVVRPTRAARTTTASQWRSPKATTVGLGGLPNEGSPGTDWTVANAPPERISLEDDVVLVLGSPLTDLDSPVNPASRVEATHIPSGIRRRADVDQALCTVSSDAGS